MRACQVVQFNEPYVTREIPVPQDLGPDDILVKMGAASFCHTDEMVRAGIMQSKLPITASHEGAGVIVAKGSSVQDFRIGDRILSGVIQGRCGNCSDCGSEDTQYCSRPGGGIGMRSNGAFADYMRCDAREAALIPSGLTCVAAAPLGCAGLTAPDRSVPFTETLKTLDELHKEGKFKKLGLSNFASFEVAEIVMTCQANSWVRPTVYQGAYNAITRNLEPELIQACRRYGLDIVVYNPLAGGFFSGKYTTSEVPSEGRYSDATGGLGPQYRKRYFKDAYFESLSITNPVVQEHVLTLIEVGLRWLVHHSALSIQEGNYGIIVGVSSLSQLKSNLADLGKGPLPEDVVQALDEAWSLCKSTASDYWFFDLEYDYDTVDHLFGK
ncbi:Aldo/keto reductase [Penicillium lividum]|nr:Aldo/keto reductase [Penicillium lividum]